MAVFSRYNACAGFIIQFPVQERGIENKVDDTENKELGIEKKALAYGYIFLVFLQSDRQSDDNENKRLQMDKNQANSFVLHP